VSTEQSLTSHQTHNRSFWRRTFHSTAHGDPQYISLPNFNKLEQCVADSTSVTGPFCAWANL